MSRRKVQVVISMYARGITVREIQAHIQEIYQTEVSPDLISTITDEVRKVTKSHAIFPDDKAAFKLVYLALRNLEKKWNRPIYNWRDALNQFAIIFGERVTGAL